MNHNNQSGGINMALEDKKSLYLILDLARYLADRERANTRMNEGEFSMAENIARHTLNLLREEQSHD
jgi:hypothetical protein